jgi:hypothetical protein
VPIPFSYSQVWSVLFPNLVFRINQSFFKDVCDILWRSGCRRARAGVSVGWSCHGDGIVDNAFVSMKCGNEAAIASKKRLVGEEQLLSVVGLQDGPHNLEARSMTNERVLNDVKLHRFCVAPCFVDGALKSVFTHSIGR